MQRFVSSTRASAMMCCACLFVFSTAAAGTQAALPFTALTLTATIPDRTYALLEPIPIRLRLVNTTSQTANGHAALNFSDEHVRVFIRPENGEGDWVQNLSPTPSGGPLSYGVFAPGEAREASNLLVMALDQFTSSAWSL